MTSHTLWLQRLHLQGVEEFQKCNLLQRESVMDEQERDESQRSPRHTIKSHATQSGSYKCKSEVVMHTAEAQVNSFVLVLCTYYRLI